MAAILDFSVFGLCRWQGFRDVSQVCFGISISNFICMLMVVIGKLIAYWFSARSLSKWPPGGHIGFFGFQTLTLDWLWISTPNLSSTILMYMCRSLLIFSNVNFKMAARQPYWNFWFPDSNFSLALNINCKLKWHNTYIYMGRSLLIFSDVTFKMAAILDFLVSGLTLLWLWISTPNFSGKVLMYMGKSLLILSDLIF